MYDAITRRTKRETAVGDAQTGDSHMAAFPQISERTSDGRGRGAM